MEMILGNYKAQWSDIDEGWDGFYDPNDPNDQKLYRFDTYEMVDGEWETIDDGSYCTAVPVGTPDEMLKTGLSLILEALNKNAGSKKRMLEEFSWMSPSWLE
jgi:hypothetical protein